MKDLTGYNLIGKKVFITDSDSSYYNEWGIIKDYDGDYFYVAIAEGTDSIPIFSRDQFTVKKVKLVLSDRMVEIDSNTGERIK